MEGLYLVCKRVVRVLADETGVIVAGDGRSLERAGLTTHGGRLATENLKEGLRAVRRYCRRRGWTVVLADELQFGRACAEVQAFVAGGSPKRAVRWLRALSLAAGRPWRPWLERLDATVLLAEAKQTARRLPGFRLVSDEEWAALNDRIEELERRIACGGTSDKPLRKP